MEKREGATKYASKVFIFYKKYHKKYEKLLFSVQCRREREMVIKWKTFSNSRSSFFFLDIFSGAETQTFFYLFSLFKKEEHNNKQQQKLGKIWSSFVFVWGKFNNVSSCSYAFLTEYFLLCRIIIYVYSIDLYKEV